MEHELVFWLEVSFQNGPPRIEAVQARDKLDAHRAVAQKYGAQYAGSGILGNTPQSKLIYIASPYAGDIAGTHSLLFSAANLPSNGVIRQSPPISSTRRYLTIRSQSSGNWVSH